MATRRDKPWDKRGRKGPWDSIVVGSGMGGMTAAALLSKVGHRVLVLEQHYVPGGFTHAFTRPGYEWDVGVHAVGEVTQHARLGRLLHYLTDGRLRWASLGPVYDEFYYPDGFRIDFPDSPQAFRANLVEAFPREEAAIDAYLALVKDVAGAMGGYYLSRAAPKLLRGLADRFMARGAQHHLERRTADVLAELTEDPGLRTVLASQWGYYGSVPSRSSFAIQALVTRHFAYGGYYPVGGSKRIAIELLTTVAKAGGWTRVKSDVTSILVENGRATGVQLGDGTKIMARNIVSGAGVQSTVRRLLPDDVAREPWARDVAVLPPAPAHVCLYLGFKGNIRSAGAGSANKWFYDTWDLENSAWMVTYGAPLPDAPCLYCSFPSLKDPGHDPGSEQRHTGEVVTFVPWGEFTRWRGSPWMNRGEEYEAFKKQMTEKLLEQFLRHMPRLAPMIDHAELSTPLTTDHFVRPREGSIYGIEPTPARFRAEGLRPRSPVKGLYFAGSEVASVGVMGAMLGGLMAAVAAEPRRAIGLLRSVEGDR